MAVRFKEERGVENHDNHVADFETFVEEQTESQSRSTPRNQFNTQVERLYNKLVVNRQGRRSRLSKRLKDELDKDKAIYERLAQFALETTKTHWRQQGIWNKDWDSGSNNSATWMHEHPRNKNWWSVLVAKPEKKPQHLETYKISIEEYDMGKAERRPLRAKPTDDSRPYNQFIYQVSKERERLLYEVKYGPEDRVDINSVAYDNVRRLWEQEGIWDNRWKTLPGMEWKHEIPDEEFLQLLLDEWYERSNNNHDKRTNKPQGSHIPPPSTARPARGILKAPIKETPPPRPGRQSLLEVLMKDDKDLGPALLAGRISPHPRPPAPAGTPVATTHTDFTFQQKLREKGERLGLGTIDAANAILRFAPGTRLLLRGRLENADAQTGSLRVTRSRASNKRKAEEGLETVEESTPQRRRLWNWGFR